MFYLTVSSASGQSLVYTDIKQPPYKGGQGEAKRQHFRLVDGSIKKQGNLHRRLVSRKCRDGSDH